MHRAPADVVEWLLDSDPAIRWQVLRDLRDASAEDVQEARARVAHEGWGATILASRREDGSWDSGAHWPDWANEEIVRAEGQPWTATAPTLTELRLLGADPSDPVVAEAAARATAAVRWEYAGEEFFAGEVEPCINAATVSTGVYFGHDVSGIVARLLTEQMADGGWNCEQENGSVRGSFDTTIAVVEALLAYERAGRAGTLPQPSGEAPDLDVVAERRHGGEEYLLARRLFRRLSTREVADPDYLLPTFPPRWQHDILRGLEHFRNRGGTPDIRLADAIEELAELRLPDGRWPLARVIRGRAWIPGEGPAGTPSRWITLGALRVARWWNEAP